MSVQHVVSLGTFTCPECGHAEKANLSPFEARVMASELVAATTPGMLPVDGFELGVRGQG